MSNQVMMPCKACGKTTIHLQPRTSHLLHLLLSLIGGLWIPIWIIITMNNRSQGQCTVCGRIRGLFGSGSGGNPAKSPPVEHRVKCPACAELILEDASVCKHCGLNIRPKAIPAAASGRVTCPHCERPTHIIDGRCRHCDKPIAVS